MKTERIGCVLLSAGIAETGSADILVAAAAADVTASAPVCHVRGSSIIIHPSTEIAHMKFELATPDQRVK